LERLPHWAQRQEYKSTGGRQSNYLLLLTCFPHFQSTRGKFVQIRHFRVALFSDLASQILSVRLLLPELPSVHLGCVPPVQVPSSLQQYSSTHQMHSGLRQHWCVNRNATKDFVGVLQHSFRTNDRQGSRLTPL
jgi:hypothetical protein